jgi:hypothetical protein
MNSTRAPQNKPSLRRLSIAGAILLGGLLLFAGDSERPAHASEAADGWIVMRVAGSVSAASAQNDWQDWAPLELGTQLNEQDMVRTGPSGMAELTHDATSSALRRAPQSPWRKPARMG